MATTFSNLLDLVYPIGSIHWRTLVGTVKTLPDPASYLGGQWAHIQNRFLLSGDANESQYPLTQLGGEFSHILSVNEMPSHDHAFRCDWSGTGWAGLYSPIGFLTINDGALGNGGTLGWLYNTNTGVDMISNAGGGCSQQYAALRSRSRLEA